MVIHLLSVTVREQYGAYTMDVRQCVCFLLRKIAISNKRKYESFRLPDHNLQGPSEKHKHNRPKFQFSSNFIYEYLMRIRVFERFNWGSCNWNQTQTIGINRNNCQSSLMEKYLKSSKQNHTSIRCHEHVNTQVPVWKSSEWSLLFALREAVVTNKF